MLQVRQMRDSLCCYDFASTRSKELDNDSTYSFRSNFALIVERNLSILIGYRYKLLVRKEHDFTLYIWWALCGIKIFRNGGESRKSRNASRSTSPLFVQKPSLFHILTGRLDHKFPFSDQIYPIENINP
jgi:hypothetical protein